MTKPYIDEIFDGYKIRTFDPNNTDCSDYVWHRDTNDREIEVLEGDDWFLQFDNELPHIINTHNKIFIRKMIYHRIIPGTTTLRIKINEKF